MSHYYTSHANLMIGLSRPTAPELVHDCDSEAGTPLVTPIHADFGNMSNSADGVAAMPKRLDGPACSEYHRLDMRSLDGGHDCPSAPRIDNGTFDWDLELEHEPSFGLDMSVDSSVYSLKDGYAYGLNKTSTHLDHPHGPELFKYSRVEARQAEAVLAYNDSSSLEDRCGIWSVPRAPRPDTGSWSSSTENVAPIIHRSWSSEMKWVFQRRLQLGSVTPSASVRSSKSKHAIPNSLSKPIKQPISEDAPTRIVSWNLGLGLTLNDIAEPDDCDASVGELSMEFTENSFCDLDTDSGCCSTANTTLNTTTETIPDTARSHPNSVVGSGIQAPASELKNTPQSRMLSFQGHHENVKRQRTQNPATSTSGTRLTYAAGFPLETDIACLVGRLRMDEHGEFGGSSNGVTLEFVAGERSLKEAQGRSEHQIPDAPIFTLLPPIEL
ncbi:hypothetical protein OPQ81_000998 [Rhizoctonia solani]|nr:hypothetical protein OPQ81_000998 [Rhizoctonia solani]